MRTIEELTDVAEPAWPELRDELTGAAVPVEVLPTGEATGSACLHRLQLTARSRLGALALHTAGLLVDHGWLRVLGAGDPARGLLGLLDGADGSAGPPPAMLVGYDVLGGRFELNGADPAALGRPGDPGELCYFGPDTLGWENLGCGYGQWLSWIAGGGTTGFYADLRWPGWEDETRTLALDQGLAVFPFLWSQEARQDLAGTSRRAVPVAELFGSQQDLAAQLDQPDPVSP
ncbi:DUF2625 family protein [Longispora sp. NPDC051575]|uniref:DUF2625 family protein n=1 Tax=Longispora sp. NPDC051575 TaxID=3154943 RepID=UPI0034177692